MRLILAFIISLFFGFCLFLNVYLPIILFMFCLYWVALFRYPEIALLFSIFVILNGFGFLHEDMLRFAGLFKIRDVFFISSFFPLLTGIYKRDQNINFVFGSGIAKVIYLILSVTVIQIFLTKLRFPTETFNQIFRVGRQYLYYAFFFPLLYVLTDKTRFNRFLRGFLFITVSFCLLFITQAIIGPEHKFFPFGRVEFQNLQGFRVVRMYLGGITLPAFVFQISFMMVLFGCMKKKKLHVVVLAIITGIQTLFTFYRAHIIGVFIGLIVSFMAAKGLPRVKRITQVLIVIFCFLFVGEFSLKIIYPEKKNFIQALGVRMSSILGAVLNQEDDTFSYRLKQSQGEFDIIIQNPILGGGFVSDESDLFATQRMGMRYGLIRAGESGILTLVFDFGLMGIVWLLVLSYAFIKRFFFVYRGTQNVFLKATALGLLSFYVGRLASFVVQPAFIGYQAILIMVLALVSLELCAFEAERWQRQKILQAGRNIVSRS